MQKQITSKIPVMPAKINLVIGIMFNGVKKPSIIPAIISMNIIPITNDTAFLQPAIKEYFRESSPGINMLLAIRSPAAPEITMAVISIMP